jgi:hypothetical protein
MFSTLAVLVYLAAFGLPSFLLYRYRSTAWYWHALAIVAALGMGFVQTPPEWKSPAFDLIFGGVFMFLVTWGFGGLITFRSHRHKHA